MKVFFGYAAAFAMNAALLASQRQHRAWIDSLPHLRRARVWTCCKYHFDIFGMTRLGIEPSLPVLVARAQPTMYYLVLYWKFKWEKKINIIADTICKGESRMQVQQRNLSS